MSPLDELARKLGVVRHAWMIVPCSGCGIACRPVEPLGCFCVTCCATFTDEELKQAREWANGKRVWRR